ncbi:MAG: type II toxin-antitoxin system HicB family antitoxin [Thermoleophilaceae bacterium]|jgi:predicted RNase H-like HicB family nuclease
MSESLQLTVVYEDAGEGWVMAYVPEVPGAISQERTRDEAREAVVEAIRDVLELQLRRDASDTSPTDSETLSLTVAP